MQEFNDLSDDADFAASQQLGSINSSIMGSSKGIGLPDPPGSEVVYLKDNVSIHPTQYTSERISGRLRLVKRGSSVFMSWIPYNPNASHDDTSGFGQSSQSRISERDRVLYTIVAVPLTSFRSIRVHIPTPLGWQYVIIVLSSGLAYPPLYFYHGGVREFLATVKRYVCLARSVGDSNLFLVNNLQDPLQKSLSSLELSSAVSLGSSSKTTAAVELSERARDAKADGSPRFSVYAERSRQRIHDPARDISMHVLEKFSLLTKVARETTLQLFGDSHNDVVGGYEKNLGRSSTADESVKKEIVEENLECTPVIPDAFEVNKISLVWGKPRQPPLVLKEWDSLLDSEGRIRDSDALRQRIFYGGIEPSLRKEVWKFLLGLYPYDSTEAERRYLSVSRKSEYETIKNQWQSISSEQARRFTKFRERRGLIDKDVVRTDRSIPYFCGDENQNVSCLRDVLLTYSFYNFDLGYCQGMSDLLAPILYIMEEESETFWCFAALMERLGPNFDRDQSGMHSQLFALLKLVELLDYQLHTYFKQADCLNYFFCFRWVLLQFKREFDYDRIMCMWEVLWTRYLSEHFHLYVCVAILKRYRRKIIREEMDFDTLLKFINELSGHIELDNILRDAEALCICAGENGSACIPPGTPPSLLVDSVSGNSSLEDDIL